MLSNSRRPDTQELSTDYHRDLVARVPGDCVISIMRDQLFWMCELAGSLSAERVDRVHRPYGWSVRQVIEHCVDAERVAGDRMLRLAAGDQNDQPAWDENAYAATKFGLGNLGHLISELGHLRQANLILLERLIASAWNNVGTVDGNAISTRAMAWITAGHLQHHFEILEQRCEIQVQRRPKERAVY